MWLKQLRASNQRRAAAWDPDEKLDLDFFICELGGEIGELCNLLKKRERIRLGIRGSTSTIEEIASELADCVICIDLCMMTAKLEPVIVYEEKPGNTPPRYTASQLGRRALWELGYVAEAGTDPDFYGDLFDVVQLISYHFNLDLATEVKKKFEQTSFRLSLPGWIEETS